jgi:hypothetical protein
MLTGHRRQCTFNPINLPDFMKEDTKSSALVVKGIHMFVVSGGIMCLINAL